MPGVRPPPETITFTIPAPSATRASTAAATSDSVATSPPQKWQWPPRRVIGGPAQTMRGSGRGCAAAAARKPAMSANDAPRSTNVVIPAASARSAFASAVATRSSGVADR